MTTTSLSKPRASGVAQSLARTILFVLRARAFFVLIALVILFASLAPSFLTANNLAILSKHVAISAILAIGMTFRYSHGWH
jgi:erythritol transport system permease protein